MISFKIFSQLMVTVSKQTLNYSYPLHFSVVLCLYLKQYSFRNKFGALLDISGKLTTKLNGFSYMILQFKLKTV